MLLFMTVVNSFYATRICFVWILYATDILYCAIFADFRLKYKFTLSVMWHMIQLCTIIIIVSFFYVDM